MDTFDLKWPRTDATFYTDGWRCRIVWRQKGGMGGTIDNNAQCKKRLADSLQGAPYLLSALKARGYSSLADEVEAIAEDIEVVHPVTIRRAEPRPERARHAPSTEPEPKAAPKAAEHKLSQAERAAAWIEQMDGSLEWESVTTRRAKAWTEIGFADDRTLSLRPPTKTGKQEWVLRSSCDSDKKQKPEYVTASHFKGICAYLSEHMKDGFVEKLLSACEALDQPELAGAATLWRGMENSPTH